MVSEITLMSFQMMKANMQISTKTVGVNADAQNSLNNLTDMMVTVLEIMQIGHQMMTLKHEIRMEMA